MKKMMLLLFFGTVLLSLAYTATITQSDTWDGFDFENWVSVTFSGAPAGSIITNTSISASIVTVNTGDYEPDYYAMHLTMGETTYYNIPNQTNQSYSILNGQLVNGQSITLNSEDTDFIPDWVTLSLSVTITYSTPVFLPVVENLEIAYINTTNSIRLEWSYDETCNHFNIYRGTDYGFIPDYLYKTNRVDWVDYPTTEYTEPADGTKYFYIVTAEMP
jgi:hypothetical protein